MERQVFIVKTAQVPFICHITPSSSHAVSARSQSHNISESILYTWSQPFKIKHPLPSSCPSHSIPTFAKAFFPPVETFISSCSRSSPPPKPCSHHLFSSVLPLLMDSMHLRCCGDDLDMFPSDTGVLALTPALPVLFHVPVCNHKQLYLFVTGLHLPPAIIIFLSLTCFVLSADMMLLSGH